MKPYSVLTSILLIILLASGAATLLHGETPWSIVWDQALNRIFGEHDRWNPLLDERIPRLIVLFCTGASLAVSGTVMQSLFQNALASPSILGISSGGCLAAMVVFIFNIQMSYPYALPFATFSGCLLSLCLVYGLSKLQHGNQMNNLILTGIAITSVFFAIQGVFIYTFRDNWQLIQTITEWEAGSTIDRGWQHVHMQLPLTLIGLFGCWHYRKEMNILTLGEEEAINLGVGVDQVRWRLFLCIALLTGGALAAVGLIAFFGLVLPHILRKACGPDHSLLIPLCILAGAGSLASLDILLRRFDFNALSIGNFSAILGGFFFLFLLFRPQSRLEHV